MKQLQHVNHCRFNSNRVLRWCWEKTGNAGKRKNWWRRKKAYLGWYSERDRREDIQTQNIANLHILNIIDRCINWTGIQLNEARLFLWLLSPKHCCFEISPTSSAFLESILLNSQILRCKCLQHDAELNCKQIFSWLLFTIRIIKASFYFFCFTLVHWKVSFVQYIPCGVFSYTDQ